MHDQHSSAPALFRYDAETAVRVVTLDGEPWFVLADLTKALGLTQFRTDRLDDGVIRNHPIPDRLGRVQNPTIVSEPGMYEVVLRSDKPEAVAFRRWLTSTVLPEIRKTGSYNTAPALTVAEAAKILSRDPSITTGRDRLFAYMAEAKWIFKSKNQRGGWEAYQTAVDTRRLVERPARPFLNAKTGAYELPAPTIRVTAKGIGKLHELMGGSEPIRFITGEASA